MTVADSLSGTRERVAAAVRHGDRRFSLRSLQDALFARLFSGLVYAQIWEDPVVDMQALSIGPEDRIVTIASGGCNALSYLAAGPESITAIDLNEHHVALNTLKIAAFQHLPDHAALRRFLSGAASQEPVALYDRHIADQLPPMIAAYWNGLDRHKTRRIEIFARGLYRQGLLGRFIGLGHALARLHRVNPARILSAQTLEEQREIFEHDLKPVITSRMLRFLTRSPAALYGLGIPPHQYQSLISSAPPGGDMADVLGERLRKLLCDFPLQDNYFAQQAIGRQYAEGENASVPPALEAANHETVKANLDRLSIRQGNLIDFLASLPGASRDCYILLDAQDWMDDVTLNRLWSEILRTARPGARVLFRTAAEASLLPGRLTPAVLDRFAYDADECRNLTAADRSAVYGGVHLYRLKD
jgi:S-adenosylmethionine-diacylglycerol 3-amino-3-carboxypropyl transferase